MGDHPAKNGRSDRGKRTIRWYRYAAAIFLPLLIASGYFIKLSRTPQEKTLVSVPFIPGKSYAVLELADGTSIVWGNSCPGTNTGGTLGGEVRFFEIL